MEFQAGFDYMYNEFKEAITIKTISRTRNTEGDTTEVESSTSTYGILTELTDRYSQEMFGLPATGETVLFLKPDETVSLKDIITVNSTNYRITDITERRVKGTEIYKLIRLSRED